MELSTKRFENKVCLVTGSSGIGKATAERIAQEGGKVALLDYNEETGIRQHRKYDAAVVM